MTDVAKLRVVRMTRTVGKKYGENGGRDKQHLERHSVESRATIFVSASRLGNCVKPRPGKASAKRRTEEKPVVPNTDVNAAALAAYACADADVHAGETSPLFGVTARSG